MAGLPRQFFLQFTAQAGDVILAGFAASAEAGELVGRVAGVGGSQLQQQAAAGVADDGAGVLRQHGPMLVPAGPSATLERHGPAPW